MSGPAARLKDQTDLIERDPSMANPYTPEAGSTLMFTTPWCGYCRRLKSQMDREGVSYSEVDIEQHPDAAEIVEKVNEGNQTVPTMLFSDEIGRASCRERVEDVVVA